MVILSHRGVWHRVEEKNSAEALARSFEAGLGAETDFRDALGRLVVSHCPPSGSTLSVEELLRLHQQADPDLVLALNVKADGLYSAMKNLLEQFAVENYFFFDMSLPDALGYIRAGLKVFTRHSDEEPEPLFYDRADGVWLDAFHQDWFDGETIRGHLDAGKKVCLVSPELHGRDPRPLWDRLAKMQDGAESPLMLCTDFPGQALKHFHTGAIS